MNRAERRATYSRQIHAHTGKRCAKVRKTNLAKRMGYVRREGALSLFMAARPDAPSTVRKGSPLQSHLSTELDDRNDPPSL